MVCSELHTKIGKREETVSVVETLLAFAMAAFHFAAVAGRIGTDPLVPDSKPRSGRFKACGQIPSAVGEMVGEFEAVVCLHTLDPHTAALEPGCRLLEEICGRIGALLRVGAQIP